MDTLSLASVTCRPGSVFRPVTVIVAGVSADRRLIDSHSSLSGVQAVVSTSALVRSAPSSKPMVMRHLSAPGLASSHQMVGAIISGGNSEPSKG